MFEQTYIEKIQDILGIEIKDPKYLIQSVTLVDQKYGMDSARLLKLLVATMTELMILRQEFTQLNIMLLNHLDEGKLTKIDPEIIARSEPEAIHNPFSEQAPTTPRVEETPKVEPTPVVEPTPQIDPITLS